MNVAALGGCTYPTNTREEGKSMIAKSWSYDAEVAYLEGGHKSQCVERKGSWKSSPAGTKAEAKVKAAEAEKKRVAALPKVTTEEIAEAYDANEVAADQRFKGKTHMVTGRVQAVRRDHRDRTYVQATGGNPYIGVRLYVKDEKVTVDLNPGDLVEAECRGAGQVMGAPALDCR